MSTVSDCCLRAFQWDGTPEGREGTLADNKAYITGDNPRAAVLLVHDLLGWRFPNVRLLADHYACEAGATVYVPDFFGGEALPFGPVLRGEWADLDVPGFMGRNGRAVREPEILACARALRRQGFARVGAVGFCYGGWAVFRLGAAAAREEQQPAAGSETEDGGGPLVDCITAGHPSLLTREDVDGVAAPVQLLAPEHDAPFSPELKSYTFEALMRRGVPFDYQHFPGVEHACLVRGDAARPGEREAMARGKDAAVAWLRYYLHRGEGE